MIVKEFYRIREDGISLYRTYSTDGLRLRKIGTDEIYDDAIDIDNASYEYEEIEEEEINSEG